MTEFALLGLILGFLYSYVSLQDKIEARKLYRFIYGIIGAFLTVMAVSYFIVNFIYLLSWYPF